MLRGRAACLPTKRSRPRRAVGDGFGRQCGFIDRLTRLQKPTGAGHGVLVSNTAEAMPTTSLGFAFAFFVAAFVSALVGLALRAYLAERLRLEHARDMVGGVTGLVMTLVALVFGLLIWTAFGVFPPRRPSCR